MFIRILLRMILLVLLILQLSSGKSISREADISNLGKDSDKLNLTDDSEDEINLDIGSDDLTLGDAMEDLNHGVGLDEIELIVGKDDLDIGIVIEDINVDIGSNEINSVIGTENFKPVMNSEDLIIEVHAEDSKPGVGSEDEIASIVIEDINVDIAPDETNIGLSTENIKSVVSSEDLTLEVDIEDSKPTTVSESEIPSIVIVFDDDKPVIGSKIEELAYSSLHNSLELVCNTQGYQKPTLNWYHNNDLQDVVEEVYEYSRSSILKLKDLSEKDDGKIYICKENRDAGSVQLVRLVYKNDDDDRKVRSSVVFPEKQLERSGELSIIVNGEEVKSDYVLISGSATLVCITQGYNPPYVGWYDGDSPLHTSSAASEYSTSSSLKIENFSAQMTGKKYTCKQAKESGLSKTVELIFHGESNSAQKEEISEIDEISIVAGDNTISSDKLFLTGPTTLTCIVQGRNPPTVNWYEGNTQLETYEQTSTYSSGSSWEIPNLPITENGLTVTCRVNGRKEITRSVTVYSIGDKQTPIILKNDKLVIEQNAISEVEPAMTLDCLIEFDTSLSLEWLYDGLRLVHDDQISGGMKKATITCPDGDDVVGRTLSCRAVSELGTIVAEREVVIRERRVKNVTNYSSSVPIILEIVLFLLIILVLILLIVWHFKFYKSKSSTYKIIPVTKN